MNVIYKLYSQVCVLVCKVKYIIYFNTFINVLLINYLYYKLWNVSNNKLILLFNFCVKLNGCIIIKFIQWFNTNLEFVFNNSKNSEFISQLFTQYYEDCPIHKLKYTKDLFFKEFGVLFDDYFELDNTFLIKSGSVAQVYKATIKQPNANCYTKNVAIKVVHPEIDYQLLCPLFYVKAYIYLVTNFKCLKKYDIVIDLDSFFCNLKKQISMVNEFNNNEYFYNNYNNNVIIIPKPLMKSKNFLIMEFIHGEQLETLDISDYKKQIVFSFIGMFVKDTIINGKYIHCDLHEANWKIYKQADVDNNNNNNNNSQVTFNYKIVVYDFGYVIENTMHCALKNFLYYLDCNNYYELGSLLFNNIRNINIDTSNISNLIKCKEEFIAKYKKHIVTSYPYSDNMLMSTANFCYINGYKLNNNLLDYFISIMLLNKHYKKYIFLNNSNSYNQEVYYKNVYTTNMFYISICEKYDVFHNIKDYLYDTYISNSIFTEKIAYTNNYFNTLKNSHSAMSENIIGSSFDI